jgi:hypothetical protein
MNIRHFMMIKQHGLHTIQFFDNVKFLWLTCRMDADKVRLRRQKGRGLGE